MREAISQYVRQYSTAARAGSAALTDAAEPFDGIAGRLVGEPLLALRQAALVDALTARLVSGPAMSDADERTAASLAAVLGLRPSGSERPG